MCLQRYVYIYIWQQVISPVEVVGYVEVVDDIADVQTHTYTRPTIVVAGKVSGEEEIPEGAVAVLTGDMPDVLSHISVRCRNEKVNHYNNMSNVTKPCAKFTARM